MIHENLRRIMAAQELTAEGLLIRLHAAGHPIGFRTIESWMNGHRTPSMANARALASALGCSIDELIASEKAAVV